MSELNHEKAVITVVGKDTVGIIARICTWLAEAHINILDISQTIVGGFFNMMMIVDLCGVPVASVQEALAEIGRDIGVDIKCQKEEIFEMMHRI